MLGKIRSGKEKREGIMGVRSGGQQIDTRVENTSPEENQHFGSPDG